MAASGLDGSRGGSTFASASEALRADLRARTGTRPARPRRDERGVDTLDMRPAERGVEVGTGVGVRTGELIDGAGGLDSSADAVGLVLGPMTLCPGG